MAVTITLQANDETSASFQKLVANLEQSEASAETLSKAAQVNSQALAEASKQADQAGAANQQLAKSSDQAKQSANEFTEQVRLQNAELRKMASEHQATAESMLRTWRSSAKATGSVSAPLSKAGQEFANLKKSSDSAGESLTVIGGVLSRLGPKGIAVAVAVKGAHKAWQAFAGDDVVRERLSDLAKELNPFQKEWKKIREEWTAGAERLREVRDGMVGITKESRKLTEELHRQRKEFVERKDFKEDLDQRLKVESEFRQISKMNSREQVREAIRAEDEKLNAAIAANKADAQMKKDYQRRFEALKRREVEISLETEQKRRDAIQRTAELRQQAEQKALEAQRHASLEHGKILKERLEKETQLRETIASGERAASMQIERQDLEFWKNRLSHAENREEQIVKLEKDSARRQHEIAVQGAKSEEDVIRAKYALESELRAIDHRHAVAMDSKRLAENQKAVEKAAQKEVQIEREKIEAIKALRNDKGQNAYESLAKGQSNKNVLDEITKRRLAESRKEKPDVSRTRRQMLDRQIRRETQRDARTGNINPGEVAKVQSDLAAGQILAANKQGLLSKEVLQSLKEQARAFQENARLQEELVNQNAVFQQFMQEVQESSKGQQQRLRSQRRGTRG